MSRRPKPSTLVRLALAALPTLIATAAEGSLVRYDFRGRIEQETASGPSVLGREFTGTLIYDDAIGLAPSHQNAFGQEERSYLSGAYRPTEPSPDGTSLQLWFEGKAVAPESTGLSGGLFTITDGDGVRRSELIFSSHARDDQGRLAQGGVSIAFKIDPSVLASGRFPDGLTVADLPEVSVRIDSVMDGRFYGELAGGFGSSGPVDSFAVSPVPEPAWSVAALLGAAAWAVRRRARA